MYFISGVRQPSEVRAFRDMGMPFGISMASYTDTLEECLLRNSDTHLFVDSGAFSEVHFDDEGRRSICGWICDGAWREILDAYQRLSRVYGKKAVFVAPDCVGDQRESFHRLSIYKERILTLMDRSDVIVPLQRGDLTLSESYDKAIEILDSRIIVGIPFKKAATNLEDYKAFAREKEPAKVHFLGLGKVSSSWPKVRCFHQSLGDRAPVFTHDSCRIRSLTGREPDLRPLTREIRKRMPYGEGGRDQAMYESLLACKEDLLKERYFDHGQLPLVFGRK